VQVRPARDRDPIIFAGGGIDGLATALALHQVGVPCVERFR